MLVIEGVFLDEDRAHAVAKFHLTGARAGVLTRQAGVKHIVPFHFSPRYEHAEARLRSELLAAVRGHDAVNPRRGS